MRRVLLSSTVLTARRLRLLGVCTVGVLAQDINVLIASLRALIKMASVFVTIKIMPETTDVDLKVLEGKAKEKIVEFGGDVATVEIEPIAFGLNALLISFIMDEKKGSPDPLEESISEIEGVASATVTDVRRTIG